MNFSKKAKENIFNNEIYDLNLYLDNFTFCKSKCERGFYLTDTPDYLDDSLKPVKVVAIVMGCTFGVLLVLTIICFIHQRPKRKGSSPGEKQYTHLLFNTKYISKPKIF